MKKFFYGDEAAMVFNQMTKRIAKELTPGNEQMTLNEIKNGEFKEDNEFVQNTLTNANISKMILVAMPCTSWNDMTLETIYGTNKGRKLTHGDPGVVMNGNSYYMPGNYIMENKSIVSSWSGEFTIQPPNLRTTIRTGN